MQLSSRLHGTDGGECNSQADYEGTVYFICFKEPLQRKGRLRNRVTRFPLFDIMGKKHLEKGLGRRGGTDCSSNLYFPLLF